MRRLAILATALVTLPLSAQAADYAWPVLRVIDGDTIVVDASADMPAEVAEVRVHLRGVDAPEKGQRARCAAESSRAAEAKTLVEGLLDTAAVAVVRDPARGKWDGRVVADIVLDGDFSLAEGLKITGLVHDSDSDRPAFDWCAMTATGPATGEGDDSEALRVFVDERLAAMDREEAATAPASGPAGPTDLQAEIERYILDPCLAISIRNGVVGAGIVDGMDEATAVATLKAMAPAEVMRLASTVRPLMTGRPWSIRGKFYDVILDICIADYGGGAT